MKAKDLSIFQSIKLESRTYKFSRKNYFNSAEDKYRGLFNFELKHSNPKKREKMGFRFGVIPKQNEYPFNPYLHLFIKRPLNERVYLNLQIKKPNKFDMKISLLDVIFLLYDFTI